MNAPRPGMGMHPGDLSRKALAAAKAVARCEVPIAGRGYGEMLSAVHIKLIWDVLELVLTPEQRALVVESLERVEREAR